MSKIAVGKKVPDFTLPATGNQMLKLSQFQGANVVIYFYPKDNTPGCTAEGQDFSDHYVKFKKLKTEILGISRDTVKSHENFKVKFDFPFELLSDTGEEACKLFDVIKEKNMYGRKTLGVERSTFLIDAKGVLRREWRKVKVKGHVEEVLEALRAL